MEKIKILMIGNDPSVKGGITSVITQLLEHDWSEENIDMKFIPTYIDTNNIKKVFFYLIAYQRIKKELKKNRPDIVHIHMSYKGSFIRKLVIHKLCKRYGVVDVIHLHGSEFKKWYDECNYIKRNRIKHFLREVNSFIVLGEKWNKIIKEIEPTTNTVVVSNTISIPEEKVEWREPIQVLFLGVLIKRKGVVDLLHAIKILKDSRMVKSVNFVIAGSGEEEEALKEECSRLGLDEIVKFVGWTVGEKKKKLLKESQILVLPSYNEGLPIAILEAISYGLPVVSTDVGDISSAVYNGKNGYLFNPGDVEKLSENLAMIINDEDTYRKFSIMSRRIAEKNFSDDKYFSIIESCYRISNSKGEVI